ncbi:hypothetical protein [Arenibacter certesii]|uniref:Uncharacterized protein n=1 Tax=Arenibacter certesii TaxID=228955 RepID=A0A918MKQ3_9FLAO|nr:hypothetical protein [Arenibacter certesii]GGW31365.1 hypothetical protein GCM10007383_15850 [Arenibacter certesii]
MKPKYKAFIYNFLGFAILFVTVRLVLGMLLTIDTLILAIIAAVVASVLAPKFAAVKTSEGDKVMMKWIFLKGVREL